MRAILSGHVHYFDAHQYGSTLALTCALNGGIPMAPDFDYELHGPLAQGYTGDDYHLDSYNTAALLEIEVEEGQIVYSLVRIPERALIRRYVQQTGH